MAGFKTALTLALGISAAALLAACDNGPSAVNKQATGARTASSSTATNPNSGASSDGASAVDHRNDPVVNADDGRPNWAASRRSSAQEGAERAFERNGEAFGAKTVDQFISKAHAFVGHPPKGTLTLTRANGDTLYYDPKGNVFAVASKEGAPRTMFKPDDGADYWQKQKAREANSRQASSRKRRSADDDA